MLSVRQAAAGDVPRIREIVAAAYAPYLARIGRPPAPVTADYDAAVASGDVWLAATNDAILGVLVLRAMADHLLLENIAVDPRAQGTGTGARLLALAEHQAELLGLSQIRLYTNAAMTENLAYYPRHGYAETHRGEQDGFARVYFTKDLRTRE